MEMLNDTTADTLREQVISYLEWKILGLKNRAGNTKSIRLRDNLQFAAIELEDVSRLLRFATRLSQLQEITPESRLAVVKVEDLALDFDPATMHNC